MFGPLGTDKYREYCRDIHQSGQYLLEVINDILDMSKIEAGRIRLDPEQVELEPFLNDAMRVVSGRADDKRLDADRPASAAASGSRPTAALLKQIVLNLLSNAVKFTPEGGRVTVRGARLRSVGQHRHRRYRHRHSQGRAGAARPAVRAGREPAHQEPPGLGPRPRDREIAGRAARRHHAHPLDPGQRHHGAAAAADRRPRRAAGRDGGSGGVTAGVRGNQLAQHHLLSSPRKRGPIAQDIPLHPGSARKRRLIPQHAPLHHGCPLARGRQSRETLRCHCTPIFASRMTFAHFAISVLIQSANSSGVLAIGSKPSATRRSRNSGTATILATSR